MKFVSVEEIKKASNVFIFVHKVSSSKIMDSIKKNQETIILLIDEFDFEDIHRLFKNYPNVIIRGFSWNIFRQKHHYRYLSNINSMKLLESNFSKILDQNKNINNFIKLLYNSEKIFLSLKKQLLLGFKKKIEAKKIYEKIVEINPNIRLLNNEINNPQYFSSKKSFFSNYILKIKNTFYFLFYPIYSCLFLKLNSFKKNNYDLAIRVYNAGFNFDESTYQLDWIVDNKIIDKNNVLMVIEDTIDKNFLDSIKKKYNFTFSTKRKPLGKLSISLLKNNLKLFFLSIFNLRNFFKSDILYQKILLNIWMNYFVWNNFISTFKTKTYLSYHDFHYNHISRNILLNRINCCCLMYKHTNSEVVFDVKEKYLNISYAYDFHDIEFHWTKESVKMSELNLSQSKKILTLSPLWSCKEFEDKKELIKLNNFVQNKKNKIISIFSAAFGTPGAFNDLNSHLSFLRFIKKLLMYRNDIFLFFKPKYETDLLGKYPNLHELFKSLSEKKNFKVIKKITSKNLISFSNLTISMPFVSTTAEAISSGQKAFWADTNNNFPNSAYMNIEKLVANSESSALDLVNYWLTISNEKFRYFLNNEIKDRLPLNFNNEAAEKIRSIISFNIRN